MDNNQHEHHIRRVLLVMDGPGNSAAALEAAIEIAQQVRAELLGLFVEDINLIRLAGLPFAREVTTHSGLARALSLDSVGRSMRAEAEAARKGLRNSAERAQLHWSFQIVRGRLMSALLSAAEESDVLIVGHGRELRLQRFMPRLTKTAQTSSVTTPVLTVFDASPSAAHVLTLAARVACATNRRLAIVIEDMEAGDKAAYLAQAQELLHKLRMPARFINVPDLKPQTLARVAQQECAARLVIGVDSQILAEAALERLSAQLYCPLLIVH